MQLCARNHNGFAYKHDNFVLLYKGLECVRLHVVKRKWVFDVVKGRLLGGKRATFRR